MPSTISGSQIATANLLIGGTYLADTISTIENKVSNNYLQAQGYGTGDVSNNYSTSTYVSNTYFQNNSSSVHALKLEGINANWISFAVNAQILTSTYYRETGLGFNEGSISWNGSTGEVTVPEAGIYFVSHSMYNGGANNFRIYMNVNGSAHSLHHISGSDEDGTRTFTDTFNLSANDVITITNVYASASTYMGSLHTWFNIFKIG